MKEQQGAARWSVRWKPNAGAAALGVMALALLGAGCAGPRPDDMRTAAGPAFGLPKPPEFVGGYFAVLLTNVDGFSARVTLETRSRATATAWRTVSGELVGRGPHLLFAPAGGNSGKRDLGTAGNAFVWDVAANHGFVISDALQGVAPMSGTRSVTNIVEQPASAGLTPQNVDGHLCAPTDVTVQSSDGTSVTLHVWRAPDLNGLPLRVTRETEIASVVLNLTGARLETPPLKLFQPPDGFTKYTNAEAMMSELATRQQTIRTRPIKRQDNDDNDRFNFGNGQYPGQDPGLY